MEAAHITHVTTVTLKGIHPPHSVVVNLTFDDDSAILDTGEVKHLLSAYEFPKEKRHSCSICDKELIYRDFMDAFCENWGFHQINSADIVDTTGGGGNTTTLLPPTVVRVAPDGNVLTREFNGLQFELVHLFHTKCIKCKRFVKFKPQGGFSLCTLL